MALPSNEKQMLLKLRAGDERAFNQLMEEYKRPLGKNMLRILKSPELTEEALQDLFVKVWLNRKQIDPELPIKAFLFRVAENLAFDLLRKAARNKKMRQHYQQMHSELYSHIEESIIAAENRDVLHLAINQLPEQRRRVFVLCKLEGKSYDEVARLLTISPATVNVQISKANIFLRNYFSTHTDMLALLLAGTLILDI